MTMLSKQTEANILARMSNNDATQEAEQQPSPCPFCDCANVIVTEVSHSLSDQDYDAAECQCCLASAPLDLWGTIDRRTGFTAFQYNVHEWMLACFGRVIAADTDERNHRFLEEALELVQACECTVSEAHQLVDYVFNRPLGDKSQEVGGVMVTLAALCSAHGISLIRKADKELHRVWQNIETIRAKQANKPKHSPLPELRR